MGPPKKYHVQLYQGDPPDEFEWDENATLGWLANRLSGLGEAQEVLAEVDEKGAATRTIDYGYEVQVVISASQAIEQP